MGSTHMVPVELIWCNNPVLTLFPSGNLMEPPTLTQKSGTKFTKVEKKTVRGSGYDSVSDSD